MDEEKAPNTQGIDVPANVSRRNLLIGLGGTAALMGLGALRYAGHTPLCRPPGGQDETYLISACIRCEKCYEACPRKIIVPAHLEDGLLGMRSPTLDFNDDFCDFCIEENGGDPLCVRVCPTGALKLLPGAKPESTIIGLAIIDEGTCLAYRDTSCRYCYDACPYEAMELSNDTKNPRPRVIAEKCNGCGACESVCVSLEAGSIATGATERAIVVRAIETLE
jgi:ferredoxin-type protein NapG